METVMHAIFGGGPSNGRSSGATNNSYSPLEDGQGKGRRQGGAATSNGARAASSGAGATGGSSDFEAQLQQQEWRRPQQQQAKQAAGRKGGDADLPVIPQAVQSLALTACYGITNLASVVMIVVANKKALFTYEFNFPVALTCLHALFTAVGMTVMARVGVFEHKSISKLRALPVAVVYVCFVVFNNWSIQLNPLGFYQMSKLAITPVLVAIEWVFYKKPASLRVLASVAVLMVGITLCTVTDTQVSDNPMGILVAVAAVLVTSLYQVWAGTKQKELGVNGMQLLQQVSPLSVVLLAALVPLVENVGWDWPGADTIMGFDYSAPAVSWILISSALGLVVTLSTFLFIGATSSLTYNVVGHLKTVLIVGAGVVLFEDEMGIKKLLGLLVAMAGIVWYSQIKMQEARQAPPPPPPAAAPAGDGKV